MSIIGSSCNWTLPSMMMVMYRYCKLHNVRMAQHVRSQMRCLLGCHLKFFSQTSSLGVLFYTDIDDLLHLYRKPSFHLHLRRSSLMMMRIPRLQHSFGRKSKRVYSSRAVNDPRRIRFKKSVSSMIMRNLRLLLSFAGVHSLLHTEDPWKKLRENSTRVFGMETSFRKLKMLRMGHKISRAIEDSRLFSKPMAHKFFEKCVTTKFKMFPAPDQCIYISFTLL